MNTTQISIITPTFNSEKSIERTLDSVLQQKTKPNEYIVVDNVSTDQTLKLVNSYKDLFLRKEIDLRIISEPDRGIYDAINKGIRNSSGDWIGIINSDDYYEQHAIDRLLAALNTYHFDIFHGDLIIFDSKENTTIHYPRNDLKNTMSIFHPTMFISKESYAKVGLYDLNFKLSADFEWVLRARKAGLSFHYDHHLISHYYKYGASYKNRMRGIFENLRIRKKHSIPLVITYYHLAKEIVFGPVKSFLMQILKR